MWIWGKALWGIALWGNGQITAHDCAWQSHSGGALGAFWLSGTMSHGASPYVATVSGQLYDVSMVSL